MKIGIPEMVTFSAIHCNCQSIGNMKVKFWGYNEKNMDFHLTPEKGTTSG